MHRYLSKRQCAQGNSRTRIHRFHIRSNNLSVFTARQTDLSCRMTLTEYFQIDVVYSSEQELGTGLALVKQSHTRISVCEIIHHLTKLTIVH